MKISDAPARDVRPLLAPERHDLLGLLDSLGEAEWTAPTEAGHWSVKDIALHLLDDDLGWLSRGRDADPSGLLQDSGDYRAFVAALDAKNQRWVDGAAGLSRRVVTDLLRWSGDQVARYHAALDLRAPSSVIWASRDPVPIWLDLARDLTERWVHQRQIRDAAGQPGDHDRFLPEVLRTFAWAFPHQYRADAAIGARVGVGLGAQSWTLTRQPDGWELSDGAAASPAAGLRIPAVAAWRQLTGLPVAAGQLETTGADSLVRPLLAVRAIIV